MLAQGMRIVFAMEFDDVIHSVSTAGRVRIGIFASLKLSGDGSATALAVVTLHSVQLVYHFSIE